MSGFTNKQRAFIDEYLTDFNATQAAIRAGYSERTAYSIGWENLNKPEIKDEIERRVAERAMSAEETLIRLGEQARNLASDYLRPDGTVDLPALLEDGKGHLIKGTRWDQRGQLVVEFYDAQSALVHVGKTHGLFRDRTELTGAEGGPVQIATVNVDTDRL